MSWQPTLASVQLCAGNLNPSPLFSIYLKSENIDKKFNFVLSDASLFCGQYKQDQSFASLCSDDILILWWLSQPRSYLDRWEGNQKHNSYLIWKMYIVRLEVKQHVSALYGHHGVFLFPLRFCYINCDVEISHPIIILVCLCIGGYYITLIYIYIYILSLLVGGDCFTFRKHTIKCYEWQDDFF